MELEKLYVAEINGHKHFFATECDKIHFMNGIWRNHPTILIVEYEINLKGW